jgi:hypothetical protein
MACSALLVVALPQLPMSVLALCEATWPFHWNAGLLWMKRQQAAAVRVVRPFKKLIPSSKYRVVSYLSAAPSAVAAAAGARVSSTPAPHSNCHPPASTHAAYKRLPATRPLSDDELIGAMFKSHDKRTSEK